MQPEQNGVATWQWVVTVIVIVALIAVGYFMFKGDSSVTPKVDDTDTSIDMSKDGNRIVVTDQFPGNIVYVTTVQLSNPGFVVIHADKSGKPGEVIGYQYFDKGINPGKITLTKPTVEGATYYAMLHSDDGDKKFDESKDLPIKDASGNIIMKVFRASSTIDPVKG